MKSRLGFVLAVVITLAAPGAYAKRPDSKEVTQLNAQWRDYLDKVINQLHTDPDVTGPNPNVFVQRDVYSVTELVAGLRTMSVADPSFLSLSKMLGSALQTLWFDEKYTKGWWLG